MQLIGFTQLVYLYLHRGLVEVVSRLAHNQEVEGSNPSPATKILTKTKNGNFTRLKHRKSVNCN